MATDPLPTLAESSCEALARDAGGQRGGPAAEPLPHADPVSAAYLIGLHPSRTSPAGVALYRVCGQGLGAGAKAGTNAGASPDAKSGASSGANSGGNASANRRSVCTLVLGPLAQEHPVPSTLSASSDVAATRPDESCRSE